MSVSGKDRIFGRNYSAWYTFELPLPFGPYKFGGLPGMIVQIQDDEGQFIWVMKGFERVKEPIYVYEYPNEKNVPQMMPTRRSNGIITHR